ncbi:MAG TPA: DUF2461 domain-containing protein [Candidatus Limnocylindrales bacterium]|jgi:uncharacterized protein (TIGR02453 family)
MTPAASASPFDGFQPEAIQFLVDLAANNERTWFQPRKAEYERLLKVPLEQLCSALDERFRARGIPLSADPGRSPFRIYRDVRFSKDKSPYKTHVSASFPWAEAGGAMPSHADEGGNPGGYFHLSPGEAYVGGGMWRPAPGKLAAFRAAVVGDPAAFHAIVDAPAFRDGFGGISGELLKRVPSGFPADHPEADLLKHKDITFGHRLADRDIYSPALPDVIADAFEVAAPLMRFLARL